MMHEQNCASDIETLTIAAATSNGHVHPGLFYGAVQVRCRSTLTAKSYYMHDDGFRPCGLSRPLLRLHLDDTWRTDDTTVQQRFGSLVDADGAGKPCDLKISWQWHSHACSPHSV